MMSYGMKMLAIIASLSVMTACGVQQYVRHTDVAGYPDRYTDFDYKYAWKTTPTADGVIINGVMKNIRYAYIDSVQLTIYALGKDGKTIARATTFPMPQQTEAIEDDVSQYSLLLRHFKPVPGDAFLFLVNYNASEGGNHDAETWISSFKVDAMTGSVIRPHSRNPDEW